MAIAGMAEQRFAVLQRRWKDRGVWYAGVEITQWNWDHTEGQDIVSYFQKCDGKKDATKAARALLARHAGSFSESITVEASLVTNLEWREPRYGSAIEIIDGEEIKRW